MAKVDKKILFLTGILSMAQTSELGMNITKAPLNEEKTYTITSVEKPPNREKIQLLIPHIQPAKIVLEKDEPILEIFPIKAEKTAFTNPFRSIDEKRVQGKDSIHVNSWLALEKTGQLGEQKYFREQEAMNKVDSLRISLEEDKLSKEKKSELEETILEASSYYGRVATNRKFRKSYDASLSKERIEKHNLDWTDCTKSVFEDFASASGDSTIINNYLKHAGEKKYLTVFPKVTAKYLHDNGYELIYVAIDTKARKWANRYHVGASKRMHARTFYRQVQKENYYAPIDYVVKDKRVFTKEFKEFIEETPAILFLEEFIHVATNYKGNMVDAKWGSSPLEENNFERRNLYDLLTVEQEDTKENVRAMVMVVPAGAVENFINKKE